MTFNAVRRAGAAGAYGSVWPARRIRAGVILGAVLARWSEIVRLMNPEGL